MSSDLAGTDSPTGALNSDLAGLAAEQIPGYGRTVELLQGLLESFGQGLVLANANGMIWKTNARVEGFFGVGNGAMIGSPLKSYCMLEDPGEIDELLRIYGDENDNRSFTDEIEFGGHWYQARFSCIRDGAGSFLGVLLCIQDIHDDEMREQQMRSSAFELEMANRELADIKDRIEGQAGQQVIAFEELRAADARVKETNDKLLKDLDAARRIQTSLLPRSIPEVAEIRFSFRYVPCETVGGDFFDVFLLDPTHLAIYLADVSGHGVSAAMLAVFAKQAIKTIETSAGSGTVVPPDEVLSRLNEELIRAQLEDMPFVTIFYGILDLRTMVLSFSAAAHPVPLVLDAAQGSVRSLEYPESSPLGWFAGEKYYLLATPLRPGERLLVHTDGVTEIFDERGETIERAGFHDRLNRLAERGPEEFADGVLTMVNDFTQKAVQDDDITLLILDRVEKPGPRPWPDDMPYAETAFAEIPSEA